MTQRNATQCNITLHKTLNVMFSLRPHFSLAFRTSSAEGLLLFVGSKQDHWHMALYMTKGRIKLSVGGNRPSIHKEKCNDGKWHTVSYLHYVIKHSLHHLVQRLIQLNCVLYVYSVMCVSIFHKLGYGRGCSLVVI